MKHLKAIFTSLVLLSNVLFAFSQDEVIKLWDNPDDHRMKRPELRVFFPADSIRKNICVLICPGGSYHHLGLTNEGSEVAETLNQWGIVAVVLRYRVAMRGNHHPAMIEDFQRGMQILREKEKEWNIPTIGCIGFSAGGHLVLMGGAFHTNFLHLMQNPQIQTEANLRPDFVCPIYPVVSMQDSIVHKKSRENLLTKAFTDEVAQGFSMESNIPDDMPPVFLLACKDDDVVNYRNSEVLDKALNQKHIWHEYHLLPAGGHGFGTQRGKTVYTKSWTKSLEKWILGGYIAKDLE